MFGARVLDGPAGHGDALTSGDDAAMHGAELAPRDPSSRKPGRPDPAGPAKGLALKGRIAFADGEAVAASMEVWLASTGDEPETGPHRPREPVAVKEGAFAMTGLAPGWQLL